MTKAGVHGNSNEAFGFLNLKIETPFSVLFAVYLLTESVTSTSGMEVPFFVNRHFIRIKKGCATLSND